MTREGLWDCPARMGVISSRKSTFLLLVGFGVEQRFEIAVPGLALLIFGRIVSEGKRSTNSCERMFTKR